VIHPLIEQTAKELPVQRLCELADVPRASFYRAREPKAEAAPDLNARVLQEIRSICEEMPFYGGPRVTAELRRRGFLVNHKRVSGLMRKANLQCRRKRRFVTTTNSKHGYHIFPNLAENVVPMRPDQLWRADITYVRLLQDFVYLAVILDAFSRKVVGWALSRHINAALTLEALEMALASRNITAELMHHSDQGVQYACDEYVKVLREHHITISMSRKANPYDNAMAESFMKTVKVEEVYINEYLTFTDAFANIEHFIEIVYNQRRLHSSLGYRTPQEIEAEYHQAQPTLAIPKTVSIQG
jgi:transposase InsO family protein